MYRSAQRIVDATRRAFGFVGNAQNASSQAGGLLVGFRRHLLLHALGPWKSGELIVAYAKARSPLLHGVAEHWPLPLRKDVSNCGVSATRLDCPHEFQLAER